MFSCPNCENVVGQYPDAGVETVVCAQCTFKYELSSGSCTSLRSQRIEAQAATVTRPAIHLRRYELAIATSPRETLRFTFATDRDDEWIHIAERHRVVVAYSMRADQREDLLFVVDRTSGQRFVLAKPDEQSKSRAILYGVLSAAVVGSAGLLLSIPLTITAIASVLAGGAVSKGLRSALQPTHALAAHERVELSARQELLAQKHALISSRNAVLDDIATRRALEAKLQSLRARMVALQLEAYAPRIAATERALASLTEQCQIDDRLVSEYDRTLQIIDIEYESSVAANALPADGAAIMEGRMAELHTVEDLRAEVTRKIAADAEVEELLRSHGD